MTRPHWRVRFMRRGMEPPYPFGKTSMVVCALTRDDAKERVPASPHYRVTASKTDLAVSPLDLCACRANEEPQP